jgi:hypothetical protein
MGLVAERLNLRLLIDGVEVPVIGVKCTFAEGTVATAQIQVVATDEVYDLLPRSFVTVYVYDNFDFIEDVRTGDPVGLKISSTDIRRWKLLFSGEIVAVSLEKQADSRVANLSCADTTNYFDFIRQHYINFRNGGVELFEAAFLGLKQDRLQFFDVITQDVDSKLYVWLTKSKGPGGVPNLYLGVQRVLREMFFSVNDFYAEAFNRLRIGDTIVGLAEDETAAKLFNLQFFEKFIKNRLGGAGGQVTARQLVDLLLGPVFHTYVTVPFPRFDRSGASIGISIPATDALSNGIIDRTGSWPGAALNQTVLKPDTWFMAPPMANVVFPHQYRALSFGWNFISEPTRLFLRTSLFFTGQDSWLTERFYAPDFDIFNDLLYKQGGYFDRLSTTLLPHEEYVGINPAMTWQPDLGAYVQKGDRRQYLAQMTHYLFWKYRFEGRQVNVTGPLNMNLIPGYPGIVLDRVGSKKHFVGNVSTVVHSIDQGGGTTHYSLTGVRFHDEVIDFDSKGRSLEEVVARGTDGFLDDRYHSPTIGKDVYTKLFGCGSVIDFMGEDFDGSELGIDSESFTGSTVADAVVALEKTYGQIVKAGGNVDGFTKMLTNRPKATFAETIGVNLSVSGTNDAAISQAAYDRLVASDPGLQENPAGFFSSATDPDAAATTGASYTTSSGSGSYPLKRHLEARREKVQAYVDSLRLRGMRG